MDRHGIHVSFVGCHQSHSQNIGRYIVVYRIYHYIAISRSPVGRASQGVKLGQDRWHKVGRCSGRAAFGDTGRSVGNVDNEILLAGILDG